MSQKLFSESDIKILSKNPNVLRASNKSITYTDDFKSYFIRQYIAGNSPTRIFQDADFNKDMIGYKRIERAAFRWKKAYWENGEIGLNDCRKENTGQTSTRELSEAEIIEKQKAKIKLLEAEVELLKKIDFKERRLVENHLTLKPTAIFNLIQTVIKKCSIVSV